MIDAREQKIFASDFNIVSDTKRTGIIDIKKDCVSQLLVAMMKLENGDIQELICNEYTFDRRSFEFSNGKFNRKRFIDIMPWAFHSDFMHELAEGKFSPSPTKN